MDIADFIVTVAVREPGRGRRSERTQAFLRLFSWNPHWMGLDRSSLGWLSRILWKGDGRGCAVRWNISYSSVRETTNKLVCTHSMLITQTGCPCPKHSASTLSRSKTKVINSLALEDPPYCQSLLLVGFKMRHFWKNNLVSPGKRLFQDQASNSHF